jgi:hypothetical protein
MSCSNHHLFSKHVLPPRAKGETPELRVRRSESESRINSASLTHYELKQQRRHLPKDRAKRAQNNWHLQPPVTALLLYPMLDQNEPELVTVGNDGNY